jgi:phospholipid-translocating ATPase
MYDEAMDQPAKANNSNINEDLGQVEYLFSDKTGTLTENEMIFKQFYLNGTIYEFKNEAVYKLGFNYPEKLKVRFGNYA